ncbi:hypothetical protein Tco_1129139 [Tanacetum coccineum]
MAMVHMDEILASMDLLDLEMECVACIHCEVNDHILRIVVLRFAWTHARALGFVEKGEVGFLEKFRGGFKQDIDDEGEEDKGDEEGDGEV